MLTVAFSAEKLEKWAVLKATCECGSLQNYEHILWIEERHQGRQKAKQIESTAYAPHRPSENSQQSVVYSALFYTIYRNKF